MPDSYKPPAAVAKAAQAALDIRRTLPPSRRGGTDVGVRRAVQLARRDPVSIDTIKRMVSLARHAESPGSAEARRDKTSRPRRPGLPGRLRWSHVGGAHPARV